MRKVSDRIQFAITIFMSLELRLIDLYGVTCRPMRSHLLRYRTFQRSRWKRCMFFFFSFLCRRWRSRNYYRKRRKTHAVFLYKTALCTAPKRGAASRTSRSTLTKNAASNQLLLIGTTWIALKVQFTDFYILSKEKVSMNGFQLLCIVWDIECHINNYWISWVSDLCPDQRSCKQGYRILLRTEYLAPRLYHLMTTTCNEPPLTYTRGHLSDTP